jgi:hypothetical protein
LLDLIGTIADVGLQDVVLSLEVTGSPATLTVKAEGTPLLPDCDNPFNCAIKNAAEVCS